MRLLDRARSRIPRRWRTAIDWLVSIGLAMAFVLAFQAEVAKPYRIRMASMEPTLHCAKPGEWCLGSFRDRVIVNRLAYRLGDPKRGQIVVFRTPPAAVSCGAGDAGGIFVKRLIGLPGDRVSERDGFVYLNGRRLDDRYVDPALRGHASGSWGRSLRAATS